MTRKSTPGINPNQQARGDRYDGTFIGFTFGLRTGDGNIVDGATKYLEVCMQAVAAIHFSAAFRQPHQARNFHNRIND